MRRRGATIFLITDSLWVMSACSVTIQSDNNESHRAMISDISCWLPKSKVIVGTGNNNNCNSILTYIPPHGASQHSLGSQDQIPASGQSLPTILHCNRCATRKSSLSCSCCFFTHPCSIMPTYGALSSTCLCSVGSACSLPPWPPSTGPVGEPGLSECSHGTSCFITILLSDENSRSNCHCNSTNTCNWLHSISLALWLRSFPNITLEFAILKLKVRAAMAQ